jgi:triacylglycerol lipase
MISHLVTTRLRPVVAHACRSAANTALPHSHGMPKYPLVLCHGYLGFVDALSPINRISSAIPSLHYFRGVVAHLRSLGAIVFTPQVPPFGSVRERSEALRTQLLEWRAQGLWRGAARVHLIGHSMGGLDARHFTSALGGADMVASVTSLVTPHHGSPVADWLLALSPAARKALALAGLSRGLEDLSTQAMREFNAQIPNHPAVKYCSFSAQKPYDEVSPMLRWTHAIVDREEGPNDGLVSVPSASWGTHVATLRCDHNELVNWNVSFGGHSLAAASSGHAPFNSLLFFRELAVLLARDAEPPQQ